jgi:penicillin-binding protein 1A
MKRAQPLAAALVRQLHSVRWMLVVGVCVVLLVAASAAWETCMFAGCPDVKRLKGLAPDRPSVVLDVDGNEFAKLFRTRRIFVSIDSLPEYLPLAFVALEDRRFFRHHGIDWIRIAGAVRSNARGGDSRQGGSTITMQLARNLYPELLPPRERTISRKLREMQVAQQLERVLHKREILELYLNQIYFGEGAYGVEAAAREYFSKSAARLSLVEVAMLAALPRAPSRTNPRTNPERAKAGRDAALRRMAAARILPESEARSLADKPLAFSEKRSETNMAPWFLEEVRKQLRAELGDALYTSGFRIFTTLNRDAQEVLEEELERQAQAVESGRLGRFMGLPDATLQFAGVILEPSTGDVLAMVGGRNFEESQFNRATRALRQPGSAFKPIVYAAALAAGFSPLHRLEDNPVQIVASDGAIWEPRNLSGEYDEEISMREALRLSRNVATVRLAHDVGLQNVARLAEQLGLRRRIPAYPSLPLGTVETTPLAMTTAFATFATLGWRPRARLVLRVEDREGNPVWSSEAATVPVLDNETAFLTLDLMRSVLEGGTGWRVREAGFWGPAAGKTGTTQDGADLWFTGFTPTRVATMWFGFDRRRPIVAGATAEDVAAPVWGRVMRRIVPDQNDNWSAPRGLRRVDVDWDGQVVTDECASSGTVYSAWVRATDAVPPPVCFYSAVRPFITPGNQRIGIPRGPLRVVRPGGGR